MNCLEEIRTYLEVLFLGILTMGFLSQLRFGRSISPDQRFYESSLLTFVDNCVRLANPQTTFDYSGNWMPFVSLTSLACAFDRINLTLPGLGFRQNEIQCCP